MSNELLATEETPNSIENTHSLSSSNSLETRDQIPLRTQVAEYLIGKIQDDGFLARRSDGSIIQEGAYLAVRTADGFKYTANLWINKWRYENRRPSEQLVFHLQCDGHVQGFKRNYYMSIWNLTYDSVPGYPEIEPKTWPLVYINSEYHKDTTDEEITYLYDLLTANTDYEATNILFADPSLLSVWKFDSVEWIRPRTETDSDEPNTSGVVKKNSDQALIDI